MDSLFEYLNNLDPQVKVKGDPVLNRVLHIDGDFVAYMASFDEALTFAEMTNNLDTMLNTLKDAALAEKFVIHLTPKGSDKGGRYDMAVFQEYQATRRNEKPSQLENIRLHMANKYKAIMHYHQEADDGLAQALYSDPLNNVLVSKDKDLLMCPGKHLNWDTLELFDVTADGTLYINDKGNVKGTGRLFLWFQMLAGDTADNIKGLPMLTTEWANVFKPTKAIKDAIDILAGSADEKKRLKAHKTVAERKPVNMGQKLAYEILSTLSHFSHKDYAILIRKFYQDYTKAFQPKHWKTGELLGLDDLFISTGRLLFMRRTPDKYDFDNWIREILEDRCEELKEKN